MVKPIVIIICLAVVACSVRCEKVTLQEVFDDRVKQLAQQSEPSPVASDGSLPVIVSQPESTQIDTRQEGKATQTVNEDAPPACTCASSQDSHGAKTSESVPVTQSSTEDASSVPVKSSKQEKTKKADKGKKRKVTTNTLPDEADVEADAPVETKSPVVDETKHSEVSSETESQPSKVVDKVDEAVEGENSNERSIEEEAPKSNKEVKNKKEKTNSSNNNKKSKYDKSGNNKRAKRDTKKGGSKNKRSSGAKSKKGGKNKDSKGNKNKK